MAGVIQVPLVDFDARYMQAPQHLHQGVEQKCRQRDDSGPEDGGDFFWRQRPFPDDVEGTGNPFFDSNQAGPDKIFFMDELNPGVASLNADGKRLEKHS